MNAPGRWEGFEVVGFAFHNEMQIDTPRGKAVLYSAGMAPQFTKWTEHGFPLEWIGSLIWKLVYVDGAVATPNNEEPHPAIRRRR